MGLVAREVEGRGIATVCVLNLRKVAERIVPPRTLLVKAPFGAVIGPPGDRDRQRAVLQAALDLAADPGAVPGTVRELDGAG